MMQLLALCLLQVVTTSLTYDVELEGSVRVGKNFLSILKGDKGNETTEVREKEKINETKQNHKKKHVHKVIDPSKMDIVFRMSTTPMTRINISNINVKPNVEAYLKMNNYLQKLNYLPIIKTLHTQKHKSGENNGTINTVGKLRFFNTQLHNEKWGQAHVPHVELLKDNSSGFIYTKADDFLPTRTQELLYYVYHVLKKGVKILKRTGKYIQERTNLRQNVTPLIINPTNDFITIVQDYLDITSLDKTEYGIDEEFVFLDVVETTNRLLYGIQKKLLNDIAQALNSTVNAPDLEKINRKLYKNIVLNKKVEMAYICEKYQVCRWYPSFIDYCADIISDIVKMEDNKFEYIVEILKDIIESQRYFFDSLLNPDDREILVHELQFLLLEKSKLRDFLRVLRAVMTQRFKIVHNSNDMLKTRTKAVRILLDIVDHAITYERGDIVSIDFTNTVHAVRYWLTDETVDIEKILTEFIENIIRTVDFKLTDNTKTEIKTLIEIILRGRTDNKNVYEYLNKYGSKFVRGEEDAIYREFV